jgi:hypothetical protein
MGHQKQGLTGIGREVFGGGDVKANLQKNNPKSEQRTKNKKQKTKNKEQRTKNPKQFNFCTANNLNTAQ